MKTRTIKTPLYRNTVKLVSYSTVPEFNKWFNKDFPNMELDIDIEDFDAGVFSINGIHYVAFNVGRDITRGVIAHECKHLVNKVFLDIRQDLDLVNDEAECYLLQWYVDEVHKFLDEK